MVNKVDKLAAEILETITKRYVVSGLAIPKSILKLKDETMKIFAEVHNKPDGSFPAEYERRLAEIKETLDKGDRQ